MKSILLIVIMMIIMIVPAYACEDMSVKELLKTYKPCLGGWCKR